MPGAASLLFDFAAFAVESQYEFRAVENSMFEVLVECDGIVRAGIDAQLAENARA